MKILVLADSRAMWPREYNWPGVLGQLIGSAHEVHTYIGGINHWLVSIHMMEDYLLKTFPDTIFDLIVVQAGWHDGGPCFWPKETWEEITNTSLRKFNPDALTYEIDHKGKTKYLYIDKAAEQEIFNTFKKRSKRTIFLGMQSIRPDNDLTTDYNLGMTHQLHNLQANNDFSPEGADVLNLPMDNEWIGAYCLPDRLHYNYNGVNFLAYYLTRYFHRYNKTLVNFLTDATNQTKFKEKALAAGSAIAGLSNFGDIVLINNTSSEEALIQFWGSIVYGRIPLITQLPSGKVSAKEFSDKMAYIKEVLNPALCVSNTPEAFENLFKTVSKLEPKDIEPPTVSPDDIAFLQLSSGTTGKVKVLKVSHRKAIENCVEYGVQIGLAPESTIASWLPLYHDMGLITSGLLPIIFNCKSFLINTFEWLTDPFSFIKLLSDSKATHAWIPNFAFSYLSKTAKDETLDLSSIQRLISCSEPSYLEDLRRFTNTFAKYNLNPAAIANCYAMAENVFAVTQSKGVRLEDYEGKSFVSCGTVISGVSLLIRDVETGEDITGERKSGKILIKTSSLVTAELDEVGYYNTGDIGFISNGEIFVIGRAKDAFVSFGNNIYPNLVEQSIKLDGIVEGRVACFGLFNQELGTNKVGLLIETDDIAKATDLTKAAEAIIKEEFDVSPVISVEPRGFLVKTSSGKISRSRTRDKVILKQTILQEVNKFLVNKSKPPIGGQDKLWSSGLLDSMDMFELIVQLEKQGIVLNRDGLTESSPKISLDKIDTINGMLDYVK